MMTPEEMLQVQAYVDGELPESERRAWEVRLARDAEARALAEELRQIRAVLRTVDESPIRVPESREFYWSGIARAIGARKAGSAGGARFWWEAVWQAWKRWLAPAAVLAALALVIVLRQPAGGPTDYPEVQLMLAESGATTYRDDARGLTLVWFTWPAEE
ncbi:hypothetical protein G4L39_13225 [Limisphaera ngatamarikiensis]|uniref:Zinc-finger domain-containing protein n=1 Tax=Limisphaera ngatamarikiensis TaxID=1324935 RepID=A0A6M1S504_9BACT|nr:hypothetical protein [Limisphaera ngatamarikiensis]NGO40350.1 hypothetical protein [Limisphaera ngatamarikiensis]